MKKSIKKSCWFLCKACRHEQYGCHLDGKIITEKCNQCGATSDRFRMLSSR